MGIHIISVNHENRIIYANENASNWMSVPNERYTYTYNGKII